MTDPSDTPIEETCGAWYRQWHERAQQERREAELALQAVCSKLRRLNVELVTIPFDGCDDSGVFDTPQISGDGRLRNLPPDLEGELLDVAAQELPCGWNVAAGASGLLVLAVAAERFVCHLRRRSAEPVAGGRP